MPPSIVGNLASLHLHPRLQLLQSIVDHATGIAHAQAQTADSESTYADRLGQYGHPDLIGVPDGD
jgi:hypothetical protein